MGISYLAAENAGLLADGAELTLLLLPLQHEDLLTKIFINENVWPDFQGKDTLLRLNAVTTKLIQYTDVQVHA